MHGNHHTQAIFWFVIFARALSFLLALFIFFHSPACPSFICFYSFVVFVFCLGVSAWWFAFSVLHTPETVTEVKLKDAVSEFTLSATNYGLGFYLFFPFCQNFRNALIDGLHDFIDTDFIYLPSLCFVCVFLRSLGAPESWPSVGLTFHRLHRCSRSKIDLPKCMSLFALFAMMVVVVAVVVFSCSLIWFAPCIHSYLCTVLFCVFWKKKHQIFTKIQGNLEVPTTKCFDATPTPPCSEGPFELFHVSNLVNLTVFGCVFFSVSKCAYLLSRVFRSVFLSLPLLLLNALWFDGFSFLFSLFLVFKIANSVTLKLYDGSSAWWMALLVTAPLNVKQVSIRDSSANAGLFLEEFIFFVVVLFDWMCDVLECCLSPPFIFSTSIYALQSCLALIFTRFCLFACVLVWQPLTFNDWGTTKPWVWSGRGPLVAPLFVDMDSNQVCVFVLFCF